MILKCAKPNSTFQNHFDLRQPIDSIRVNRAERVASPLWADPKTSHIFLYAKAVLADVVHYLTASSVALLHPVDSYIFLQFTKCCETKFELWWVGKITVDTEIHQIEKKAVSLSLSLCHSLTLSLFLSLEAEGEGEAGGEGYG